MQDHDLELYRRRAAEARENAKAAKNEDARTSWIKIAKSYDDLAAIRLRRRKPKE